MPDGVQTNKSGRGRVAVPACISDAIPNAEGKRNCFIAGVDWRTGRGLLYDATSGQWRQGTQAARLDCRCCGHIWQPHIIPLCNGLPVALPKCCPRCKSPYWNTPRKYKLAREHRARPEVDSLPRSPMLINRTKAIRAETWDKLARARVADMGGTD